MVIVAIVNSKCQVKTLLESRLESLGFKRIVHYTTREKLDTEENHKDNHFVTSEQFDQLIKSDILVEWETVDSIRYGLPKPVGRDKFVCKVSERELNKLKDIYGDQVIIINVSGNKYINSDVEIRDADKVTSQVVDILRVISDKNLI